MTRHDFQDDIDAVGRITAVPSILEVLCKTTGMNFAAVARVTENRWVTCVVQDQMGLGLEPGAELEVRTTLCDEVREKNQAVVIDHAAMDSTYCTHLTPAMYGFQSYVSVPIERRDGSFFGTLCALDPRPIKVNTPETVGMFRLFAKLIAFYLDADDRLAAAQAIRRSDALTQSMLAATPDCVNILSADGIIEFMNARGVELNQFSSEDDVIGTEFAAMWPEDDRANVRAAIQQARLGNVTRVEGFCPTAKGEPRWWEASFARFYPAGEHGVLKIVGVSRDVSERVGADEDRRQRAAELRELNDTLEQRVEARTAELQRTEAALRQSQKMEAVGQLTGGLAHDFNNLLTGITGNLELLERRISEGQTTDLGRFIVAAQAAGQRAAALTHRLLAFSRQQTLDPKATRVDELVDGMVELIRNTVGSGIALDIIADELLWTTLVDPSQLENALLNLCINARDAMPDGGRLVVKTCNLSLDQELGEQRDIPAGDYVVLSVEDTGTGMKPDTIARAFDPFFTTKPIGQGTGLGLSMIYGFTKQSGGHVRIQSEAGRGTVMFLYLPRHTGTTRPTETASEPAVPINAHVGETVLVVEDELAVSMLITEVLEDLGYLALSAANGPEGLKILRSDQRIDLLVTDVGLPGGMNGRQVADAARLLRPGLKVLFMTGYARSAILHADPVEPGTEVLIKPFSLEVLARRIKAMIADGARASG